MANTKEAKRKELIISADYKYISCNYAHTDEQDIFYIEDIPAAFINYLACLGIKHSLGDTFDTYKIDGSHATPSQKRTRMLDKWASFTNGQTTLKPAATPKKTKEERIAEAVVELVAEGLSEDLAIKTATNLANKGII